MTRRKRGKMKSKIIAEDEQILVCFKPAGLAVQSGRVGEQDMVSELKNYLASGGGQPYLGLIHRLDQPVSGLLVFAKTPEAAASLSRQAAGMDGTAAENAAAASMKKEYTALVYIENEDALPGEGERLRLENYLVRDSRQNISRVAAAGEKGAKRAALELEVLERPDLKGEGKHALVRIRLETGRHHQIRIQCSYTGIPLLGDARYGSAASKAYSAQKGIRSICLCASSLSFQHPAAGRRVEISLPGMEDMLAEGFPWKI